MRAKELLKRIVPPSTTMMDARLATLLGENARLVHEVQNLGQEVRALRCEVAMTADALSAMRAPDLVSALEAREKELPDPETVGLVVSVASYGPRIGTIAPMIRSLAAQTRKPDLTLLWLPLRDFPKGLKSLPPDVICAAYDADVCIRFVEEDFGPHNKYYWTMREYPDSAVITLDDDIRYSADLIERLVDAHTAWPRAVVGMRTHLITFEGGGIAPYASWQMEQREIVDRPSHRLLATGVAGVLYPPRCLHWRVFDAEGIMATCLRADDLWLKIMELLAGTEVVCPSGAKTLDYIDGTQEVALYISNLNGRENDLHLQRILSYVGTFQPCENLLKLMAGDGETILMQ